MKVGQQSTRNDLLDIAKSHESLKSDFEVVKGRSENGSVGAVIDGSPTGELGRGARSFGIRAFFTEFAGAGYIHVKTSLRTDTHNEMFHVSLLGYAPSQSEIIDNTFAGYCNAEAGQIVASVNSVGAQLPATLPAVYVSSGGFVTLRIQMSNMYYSTLVVDSMKVGNGRLFTSADIDIVASASEAI